MDDRKTNSEDGRRVAELLRVNAELAAEIRSLEEGRTAAPRRSQVPAARWLARLEAERDQLSSERDSLRAEFDATRAELGEVEAVRDDLLRHKSEQEAEIARLRSGFWGMLRRGWSRLLRSS
jgi:predicted  nucleic acid-binding Zn-ribbon protein